MSRVICLLGTGLLLLALACGGSPSIPTPASTPATRDLPTPTQAVPTPTLAPADRHLKEKRYMLALVNEARAKAGVPTLVLGDNPAAQIHAEASLAACISSHWSLDGLTPDMRYNLAGGYQANQENVLADNYCYSKDDGYAPIDIRWQITESVPVFMGSAGHRKAMLGPHYRRLNVGLAWNEYNVSLVQQFETDYLEYDQLPRIDNGVLRLAGHLKNGAWIDGADGLQIHVVYHAPPQALTPGQVARVYSMNLGQKVVYIERPVTGLKYEYTQERLPDCLSPHDVPASALPASSHEEKRRFYDEARAACLALRAGPWPTVAAPQLEAREWAVTTGDFQVEADLSGVLAAHGPGVYIILLWANGPDGVEDVPRLRILHLPQRHATGGLQVERATGASPATEAA